MTKMVKYLVVVLALVMPVVVSAAGDRLFGAVDSDKSGSVSKDELLKADLHVVDGPKGQKKVVHRDMLKEGAGAAAMTEEQKRRLFDRLDSNKDGQVSRKEWNRASPNGFILWKF